MEIGLSCLNIKINIKTFKQVKCKRKPLPLKNSELLTKPYKKPLQKKSINPFNYFLNL